jgi:serine/threonine protein kinase
MLKVREDSNIRTSAGRVTPYSNIVKPIVRTQAMDAARWRQIEQIYHSALKKDPEHRISFLASACGDDEDLLRQVVSLLAKSGSTGVMVDRAREAVAGGQVETSDGLVLGAKLGQYQILGPLGEGGMGKVYRALDTRLDRAVAIKISRERFSQRFEREARAFSALNHPHVCTLYDVGSLPSGLSFMVTELVEGETLRDWLKRAPDLERSLAVARQVLEALRAAHNAGIVHRDLKPANIMVRFDGYVKVLDFGLAKRIPTLLASQTDGTATLDLSVPGQITGTIAYISPEQILGAEADQRSDLFTFGIVFYEMLTRQHPWPRGSTVDILHAILHDDPPAMPATSPVRTQLAGIVQRLLRKSPAERYPSADAVLEALASPPPQPRWWDWRW